MASHEVPWFIVNVHISMANLWSIDYTYVSKQLVQINTVSGRISVGKSTVDFSVFIKERELPSMSAYSTR